MRARNLAVLAVLANGCSGSTGAAPTDGGANSDAAPPDAAADAAVPDGALPDAASSRGFPVSGPWVSFYGTAAEMGDLAKVAATFRVINLDADPDGANFTAAQIQQLRAGGQNRVISYLNLGSCEMFRSYWSTAPAGLVSCSANTAAQLGPYQGYPDEVWMNLGDADYQNLILQHVAPRLASMGVDGFFLDNLELVEHGTATSDGPCDPACSQGGLDLVRKLREKFPALLIVMQNATSDRTRLGSTGGLPYPSLLDGISHEEVYVPPDSTAQGELAAWRGLGLTPGGRPFWIATEDYVGSCTATSSAQGAYDQSRDAGFSPYATDQSAGQRVVCYWPF
ncbi:MAG TPA: endo alpha-1,4 polygalactosaminidase [Polyangia bacterium]|nr:endo alpha-1,4 polygalactosaminidase [Polyangia bacterium]